MKKNKGLIIGILVLFLARVLYLFLNINKIIWKTDRLIVEYGEEITFNIEDVFETTNPKVLDSLKIDQSNIDFEVGKDYPIVGEHHVIITYIELFQTHSKDFTLVVKDTKAPIFVIAPESIECQISDAEYDFASDFEVEDLSEFEFIIDTHAVNFEKEGIYKAKASATDVYGNQAEHSFNIIVKEEKKNEGNASVDITPEELVDPMIKNGILVVNKKHPLPVNYAPGEDPTAVGQLNKIIREMQRLGYDINDDYSGFRTYEYQKYLYEGYVASDGQEAADTYSARPGYSEHQTGLTFDLKHWDGTLVTKEAEAQWIAENAADYGFIVRYQVGKEHITGYQAEPWHLRYIGDEAMNIYNSGLTLEEYLGVEGGDYPNE